MDLTHGKYLSVDYGDVRTGLATCDPSGLIAEGLETVRKGGMKNTAIYVAEQAKKLGCKKIIVGLPKNMDGSHDAQGDDHGDQKHGCDGAKGDQRYLVAENTAKVKFLFRLGVGRRSALCLRSGRAGILAGSGGSSNRRNGSVGLDPLGSIRSGAPVRGIAITGAVLRRGSAVIFHVTVIDGKHLLSVSGICRA